MAAGVVPFRVCSVWCSDDACEVSNSPLPCYAGVTVGSIIAAVGSTRGIKQRVFFSSLYQIHSVYSYYYYFCKILNSIADRISHLVPVTATVYYIHMGKLLIDLAKCEQVLLGNHKSIRNTNRYYRK